tara:strand:+ start:172 stop:1470 length:1299 start_codon:yes stop_codon:yes gene_type:complete
MAVEKTEPENVQNSGRKHVVIIGAGIVGVSSAVWLQRAGHAVTLIDKGGPASGTSYGNGGVLTTIGVVPVTVPGLLGKVPKMLLDPNQPLFLRWSYLPRLLPWLLRYLSHATAAEVERISKALAPLLQDSVEQHKALSAGTKAGRYVHDCDYVYAYDSAAAAKADAFGWNVRSRRGCRWSEMDAAAFDDYDPVFAGQVGYAHVSPDNGRISDPGAYVVALADHVIEQGGRLLQAEALDLEISADVVTAVETSQGRVACDEVLLAAGVWSGPLARKLGVQPSLESERGYHVEFINPSVMPRAAMMMAAEKFVITPMEGRLRAAGIVEFGGLKKPPQQAGFDLLIRQVKQKMPGLTWDRIDTWMGHRPATSDSIPLIGKGGHCRNAWFGFGHHHVGLTAGPKTGRILADCISGVPTNIDLGFYNPDRFSGKKES